MVDKSILEEAIAEAKAIREAAITNAYKTLEENLTPSIKEMLASKLEEELDLQEEDGAEEQLEEDVNAGFKKVSVKKAAVTEAEEDVPETGEEEEGAEEDPEAEEGGEDLPAEDGAEEGSEEDPEAVEDPEAEGEPSDDTSISDLTVGELKDLITSIVGQVSPEPAPEGDLGADMEVGDVEGAGEEDAPLEGDPEMEAPEGEIDPATNEVSPEEVSDDEEIDLSELLRELEDEESKDQRGKYRRGGVGNSDHENLDEVTEDPEKGSKKFQQLSEELDEAYSIINDLRTTLADTNLLNSKLMYTTRLFNEHSLSDSQKANVIRSLDRAKNLKEVKIVYTTLSESIQSKSNKSTLKEHKGSASRAAGKSTAAKQTIVESNSWVQRMQQLAGII